MLHVMFHQGATKKIITMDIAEFCNSFVSEIGSKDVQVITKPKLRR